jgi:two-component system, OmpR family, response regulator VicR
MKKILYIEDDKDIAEAVRLILQNSGFHSEIVHSGKDGLKKAKENFDIILLDIMLPDMSGWEIFERLKKEKTNSKFAFLSAIPIDLERLNELKKSGISDYILKPFAKEDLIKRMRMIFEAKVLYVEDNEDTADAVKIILNNAGFQVETALSGKEAFKKINKNFDLVLLDLMLPDMSGWDIFETLKKKEYDSKFAFLTSVDADLNRINELKNHGISDYIIKPFIKEDLIKRIHKIAI